MKKTLIILGLLLLASATPARAGIYYDLQQTASSATLRMVGAFKMYASAFSGSPTIQLDSVGGSVTASSGTFTATGTTQFSVYTSSGVTVGTNAGGGGGVYAAFFKAVTGFYGPLVGNVTGNVTGNLTGVASQATIWDHTPTTCSAGQYARGTDTGGNAVNCTAAGVGDVTSTASNSFNTAGTNQTFGSSVTFNGGIFGTIAASSSTVVPETVFTQANFALAVATVTFTTGAKKIKFTVAGGFFQNSTQDETWTVYCDNAPCTPLAPSATLSLTRGMFVQTHITANRCMPASGSYTVAAVSAGSHNFSLRVATDSGVNLRFVNGTSCGSGQTMTTTFTAEEVP